MYLEEVRVGDMENRSDISELRLLAALRNVSNAFIS